MIEAKQQRDYLFDNLKFILISMVVIAHFISPLGSIFAIRYIYRYIYIFHMPAMIFISGYFSKKSVKDGKLLKNKIFNYILIYIIFQTIYTIINGGKFSIYQSQMGLWYIQCLIIYQMILPIITRIKPKYSIVISVILCLLVGIDRYATHTASLSRSLVFLPFFLTGFYLDRQSINKLCFNKFNRILGVFIFFVVGFILFKNLLTFNWLLNLSSGKASYLAMNLSILEGIIYRFIWLVITLLLIFSLIAIIPNHKTIYTKFGSKTLQVYLLHLIIIIILRNTSFFTYLTQYNQNIVTLTAILLGEILTIILSFKIFSYPFDFLMNIKFRNILLETEEK